MNHTHFGNRGPLWRSLIAFIASVMWCSASVAWDDGYWSWHHRSVTISGTPATSVTAGQAYLFVPTATDPYYRALVFSITNRPAWASFSSSTGQLSGTPSAGSVGTYSNIVISVTDGRSSAALPVFAIQVLAGSTTTAPPPSPPPPPPVISGTPATSVVAGNTYSFQPSASGPSGMTLSFSVQNKPSWATFSIASGLLSGVPSSTQTGTYSNIVLSVSDGQASGALPAFAITVTAPAVTSGSATVKLVPPTQNTNGSPLTDLAGMRIYYGTSPASLTQMVQLPGSVATSYTVSSLPSGTWYFGGTAYTTNGEESTLSSLVSKTVP
jgi:hypothetical protein